MDKEKKPDRRELISDCLMLGGGLLLSIGAGISSVVAGLIVGGVVLMIYGILVAVGGDKT